MPHSIPRFPWVLVDLDGRMVDSMGLACNKREGNQPYLFPTRKRAKGYADSLGMPCRKLSPEQCVLHLKRNLPIRSK
jgi:hypothetical protein